MEKRKSDRRHVYTRIFLPFACCLLCSLAGLTAFMGVVMLMNRPDVFSFPYFVAQVIVPSLVLGLGVYVINLPYLLPMFRSPFFRRRFQIWLGVESLLPQVQAANPEGSCSGSNE